MRVFKFYPESDDYHASISTTKPESINDVEISILDIDEYITTEQMDAMADALNTYHATGMTPSQLAERVKVLEDALREIKLRHTLRHQQLVAGYAWPPDDLVVELAEKALAK